MSNEEFIFNICLFVNIEASLFSLNKNNITENDLYLKLENFIKSNQCKNYINYTNDINLESFLSCFEKVCNYESQTFLSDEDKIEYAELMRIFEKIKSKIILILKNSENISMQYLNKFNFRLFVANTVSFKEWLNEVNYFDQTDIEQIELLKESPILTIINMY